MRFRITYNDPETGDRRTTLCEFEDTPHCPIEIPGQPIKYVSLTARQWAEDYAYSLARKGWFTVIDIRERL